MATPPQVSPDGAHWWDGQAWQPTLLDSAATSATQSVQEAAQPSWLPAGVELPSPSDPPDAPLTPAVIGAPDGSVFTPAWAGETDAPDTEPIDRQENHGLDRSCSGWRDPAPGAARPRDHSRPARQRREDGQSGPRSSPHSLRRGDLRALSRHNPWIRARSRCIAVFARHRRLPGRFWDGPQHGACGRPTPRRRTFRDALGDDRRGCVPSLAREMARGGIIVITWAVGAAIILTMGRS